MKVKKAIAGMALGGIVAGTATTAWAQAIPTTEPEPWQLWLQPSGSPIMSMIAGFMDGVTIAMALIVLLVLALLAVCIVRFNARANPVPSRTSHNTLIEVIWTVVPVLILVGIAVPSFSLLIAQYNPARAVPDYNPDEALTVKATGLQWYWGYEYPDNGDIAFDSLMLTDEEITDPATQPRLLAVDNQMIVPTDTVIRMQVIGADVIHSFTVPSLGFKVDAVPGRLNETWFLVEREGVYYGQCSELCGRNHSFMPIAVRAVSPEKFEAWAAAAVEDLDAAYALLDNDASATDAAPTDGDADTAASEGEG